MTEVAAVHITRVDQWEDVLTTWFDKGARWSGNDKGHNTHREYFTKEKGRYLYLNGRDISWSEKFIEVGSPLSYYTFRNQNKRGKGNDVETYYVTSDQKRLIWGAHESPFSVSYLVDRVDDYYHLFGGMKYGYKFEKDLLRYLSGDSNVRFEVKEPPMYRLVGEDNDGDLMYFVLSNEGAPTHTYTEDAAFTASLEEIEKWKTPAWKVERVEEKE